MREIGGQKPQRSMPRWVGFEDRRGSAHHRPECCYRMAKVGIKRRMSKNTASFSSCVVKRVKASVRSKAATKVSFYATARRLVSSSRKTCIFKPQDMYPMHRRCSILRTQDAASYGVKMQRLQYVSSAAWPYLTSIFLPLRMKMPFVAGLPESLRPSRVNHAPASNCEL